jgi:hypothetical protein
MCAEIGRETPVDDKERLHESRNPLYRSIPYTIAYEFRIEALHADRCVGA